MSAERHTYYSCGKLLISGEYLILRGARGLALPTSRGQHMHLSEQPIAELHWSAQVMGEAPWLKLKLALPSLEIIASDDLRAAERLQSLLMAARRLKPDFLDSKRGFQVQTRLEFPRDWGLGSSSTLVHLVSQWAQVDPYQLSETSFGGSGYDVMLAEHASPIFYNRTDRAPHIERVEFEPSFADQLWFVHVGQKQDSSQELKRFKDLVSNPAQIEQISLISHQLSEAEDLARFEQLLRSHNELLSYILERDSAQERYPEYPGVLKYLGAWGGDFMLATGPKTNMNYFKQKGMEPILSYQEMIAI